MKILIAGVGNLLRGDDGFGVEVGRRLLTGNDLPSGVKVLEAGISGISLVQELMTSLWLNFEAIFYSSVLSLGFAYLTVLPGVRPVVVFASKLRFLGLTGLTFVFGLIVTGHQLKVWMLVFGMTVFFLTSMAAVVAAIPKEKFDHARTLRMGEWRVVWEVVVLGTSLLSRS